MKNKILICGLPGSGKTTLAKPLAACVGAVWLNGDAVRKNISRDLGFSLMDRVEQARRMGWLCDRVVEAGGVALADFVCPTQETREAFGDAFVIWINRIQQSRYDDTNRLFVAPKVYDLEIDQSMSPEHALNLALRTLGKLDKLSLIAPGRY
jgi:chloramphenicol 3-O-phosphotransferase